MSPALACTSEAVDRATQVVTALEARVPSHAALEPCLSDAMAEGKRILVVDLTRLDRLWPTVVVVLLRTQRQVSWRGGLLLVVSRPGAASDLDHSGLEGAFDLFETREAAIGFAEAALAGLEMEPLQQSADGA